MSLCRGWLTTWELASLRANKEESEKELANKQKYSQSVGNVIPEVPFYLALRHILFVKSESLGPIHSQRDVNIRGQHPLGATSDTVMHDGLFPCLTNFFYDIIMQTLDMYTFVHMHEYLFRINN